tara:strand:- start:294 stop:488 length:195 start_codon:yes stop_codon:yes gene_type:complete
MIGFVYMTPLQQARALYADAYRDAWGCEPEHLSPEKWNDIRYLEASTEGLIDIAIDRKHREQTA